MLDTSLMPDLTSSVSPNHINDFSATGRAETMANLDKVGIGYAGLPECRSAFKEVKGLDSASVPLATILMS